MYQDSLFQVWTDKTILAWINQRIKILNIFLKWILDVLALLSNKYLTAKRVSCSNVWNRWDSSNMIKLTMIIMLDRKSVATLQLWPKCSYIHSKHVGIWHFCIQHEFWYYIHYVIFAATLYLTIFVWSSDFIHFVILFYIDFRIK